MVRPVLPLLLATAAATTSAQAQAPDRYGPRPTALRGTAYAANTVTPSKPPLRTLSWPGKTELRPAIAPEGYAAAPEPAPAPRSSASTRAPPTRWTPPAYAPPASAPVAAPLGEAEGSVGRQPYAGPYGAPGVVAGAGAAPVRVQPAPLQVAPQAALPSAVRPQPLQPRPQPYASAQPSPPPAYAAANASSPAATARADIAPPPAVGRYGYVGPGRTAPAAAAMTAPQPAAPQPVAAQSPAAAPPSAQPSALGPPRPPAYARSYVSPASATQAPGLPDPNGSRRYSVHRQYGMEPDAIPVPPQFFGATADLSAPETEPAVARIGPGATKAAVNAARLAQSGG